MQGRPWIEAAALLGVRGGAIPTNLYKPRPIMPPDAKFALIKTPVDKPFVCGSLHQLARRIHAERGESDIMVDRKMKTIFPIGPLGVKGLLCARVYKLGIDGETEVDLGYAYAEGSEHTRDLLIAELYRQQPRRFAEAS